jgi:hypothetical protein
MKHPMVTVFPGNDIIPEAIAKLNEKGRNLLHDGRGATVKDAMLALASKMENLAVEIRAAAEAQ